MLLAEHTKIQVISVLPFFRTTYMNYRPKIWEKKNLLQTNINASIGLQILNTHAHSQCKYMS